ncbi:cell division protein ZapA [Amaricoccus sp.]|uniref:cell division protein ZapA n=1 Tax=Amaricoccus sp. TaxID=1872485 RepID=UPI001B7820DA|nr:cell division protein ZapA [Amaricoccus sp.]MBP7241884.1 cell division protein ZapA [Amaricoccus sp.]
MPELTVEIGGRVFDVACEPGQEPSLARAAQLLDAEAVKVSDSTTERRMLLLAGLLLADSMTALEDRYLALEDRLRQAEERARIAEAKSAMLAANALKLETQATHIIDPRALEELHEEKDAAVALLAELVEEIEALAERAEAGAAA